MIFVLSALHILEAGLVNKFELQLRNLDSCYKQRQPQVFR